MEIKDNNNYVLSMWLYRIHLLCYDAVLFLLGFGLTDGFHQLEEIPLHKFDAHFYL
jgi:hypothetical protein